jgi:tetratricopeptide (TPR) repeat protein
MASLEELLDLYIAGPEAVDRFTHGLRVQTDDHPIVVFTTEYSRGRRFEPPLLLAARAFAQPLSSVLPLSQPLRPDERKRVDAALEAQGLVTAGQLARASELRQEGTKLRLFQGQAQTTRTYYLALAERYPDDPERLFEAATQLSTLGHGAAARGVFERALALEPRSLPLTLNYALLLGALGERKRSLELLAALQRRHPRSSLVLRNLAAAALADNDPGLAAKHLVQALQWDATDQGARTELARSRLLLGELERALADVQAVLRDSPWEREAHVLAGRIMVEQGDLGRAERHFRTALAFDSTCAETWHRLGTVLEASGSVEPSAAAYEQALRMEPNRAVSLDALGRLETSRGRHEHALELHVRALEADPTLARAAYHLGESLLALGRTGDAGEAFCLALRLEPRHAQARKSAAASNADCTSAPPPR